MGWGGGRCGRGVGAGNRDAGEVVRQRTQEKNIQSEGEKVRRREGDKVRRWEEETI